MHYEFRHEFAGVFAFLLEFADVEAAFLAAAHSKNDI